MLPKLFIKDYKEMHLPRVRNAYGMLASIVGIFWNVVLSSAKIAVGVIFNSIAILADGLNNLSDAGSSLVTLLGFGLANKPADKEHPFGHARVEYVASMVVSFIILFLGIELFITSIKRLFIGSEVDTSIAMMVVLGVSVLVKIAMFVYYRNMSKKIDSTAFKVASIDSINDSIATFAVLIVTLVMYFTDVNLDGYMGIIVAILIFVGGVKLFKDTISPLLGETPSDEFVSMVSDRIHSYDGVIGMHDLIVHNYGPNKYHISAHVEVDAKKDILVSHELIDMIERDFKKDGIDLVIHLDPIIVDDARVDALHEMVKKKVTEIDSRISCHDFRVVYGGDRKKLIFDIAVPCDFAMTDDEIVSLLEEKIEGEDDKCMIVVDVDRNYVGDVK